MVAAVAYTGVAALLLLDGTTAHSRFRLPLKMFADSTSGIQHQSREAHLLRQCKLILWDEACMQERYALEVVDKLMRDLAIDQDEKKLPFGGTVVVLGGDWHQVLPVIPGGTKQRTISRCIKGSALWESFQVLRLTENMRTGCGEEQFAKFLVDLGEGRLQYPRRDSITARVPSSLFVPNECDVIDFVFGNGAINDVSSMRGRAVLTVTNEVCDELNLLVLAMLSPHVPVKTFMATDKFEGDFEADGADLCDHDGDNVGENLFKHCIIDDYLDTTKHTGMPPKKLLLKAGAVIMLLRNLDLPSGLCNGTRLIIDGMQEHTLRCTILNGTHAGESAIISRTQ